MYRVAVINKWRQIFVFRFSTLIEVNLIRIGSTNVYLFCGVRNLPQYHMLEFLLIHVLPIWHSYCDFFIS